MLTTEGSLLDGRVRYTQPADGYRTGIEPVLLAASVPAQSGQLVLEAGTGAGAGLLCLAARVPGVCGLGVEIDPAMADLAERNFVANGFDRLAIVAADIADWRDARMFDHAFSNPPWHDPVDTLSPIARRRLATHSGTVTIESWITAVRLALRPGGSLTLVVPASQLLRAAMGLQTAKFGQLTLFPLWPKPGRDAKLALIRGYAARQGADRVSPGLVLHNADGRFSDDAQSLLRGGTALTL